MPDAVLYTCLTSVQTAIQSLGLSGLDAASVLLLKVPETGKGVLPADPFPCILITPMGAETIPQDGGTNARDVVVYPILVAILDADAANSTTNLNRNLTWRQAIRRAFHNVRLTGADTVYQVQVQPQAIIDTGAWFERNLFVSALLLQVYSKEGRS